MKTLNKKIEKPINIDIIFKLEKKVNNQLNIFYKKLKNKFPEIIIDRKKESLPFHFTIIGAGKVSEKDLKDFINNHSGIINDVLKKLKMFNSEKMIPNVKSFGLSWHAYPNGKERILIIRLKLEKYILSGNKNTNKELAIKIGNPNMDFTLPSHISICKFSINKNQKIKFDDFLKEAQEDFKKIKINKIQLIPSVFTRREKSNYKEIKYNRNVKTK